jgi:ectoine hydroxylase-related dioxygenase (phytanoyl-CoA dioxygenase family)
VELIAHDRGIGAEIYDAVKQIPAFVRLVGAERHEWIVAQLRGTDLPGTCHAGSGIRIDNPNEEKFRADWHQDYPAQFRSLDGIVFWSPLVRIEEEMGPVRFCLGSHKDGLVPVVPHDADHPEKTGAYALILQDRDRRIARYPQVAPLSGPGDLVLIDFLTLHASGYNRGRRSRWSMQMRYFNFREETGIRIGWRGSFAAGVRIEEIHPELIVA